MRTRDEKIERFQREDAALQRAAKDFATQQHQAWTNPFLVHHFSDLAKATSSMRKALVAIAKMARQNQIVVDPTYFNQATPMLDYFERLANQHRKKGRAQNEAGRRWVWVAADEWFRTFNGEFPTASEKGAFWTAIDRFYGKGILQIPVVEQRFLRDALPAWKHARDFLEFCSRGSESNNH
jgi:hypothetical protein